MRLIISLVLLLSLAPPCIAAAQEVRTDAYLDTESAGLVRAARERRNLVDRRIERYRAQALERISARLRVGIGERLLFRREVASRIDWTADTVRVDILGAREVVPVITGAPQVPSGLSRYMPSLAFDPVDSEMLLRLDSTSIRHPLAADGEENYRFRAGDSTVIRLPNGRAVRLRELQFMPRRRSPSLITGSFWLDMDTHAVVQAYFRLARAYDSERDDDDDGAPPFLRPVRAELDYVAIDYGLWDLRWWLPRSVAAHGLFQAGSIRVPLSFERLYDDYIVEGDTVALPPSADQPLAERPCRPRVAFSITVGNTDPDSAAQREAEAERRRRERERAARTEGQDTTTACDREFIVTRPSSRELLESPALPEAGIYASEPLLDPEQLRRIAERVAAIADPPWQLEPPVLQLPPGGAGLVRYNRVEGLSLGARALMDLGGVAADAQLHVATAEPEVFVEAGVTRPGRLLETRLAGYRRLDVADVASRPFTLGSSLGAALFGRDDNDYFRTTGAELIIRPAPLRRQWVDLRLFAEAQRPVGVNTDFSVRRWIDDDRTFRPNIQATRADQAGATLRLRLAHGLDPRGFRAGSELEIHGEMGDFELLRPALRVRMSAPLLLRVSIGVDALGGTTFGDVIPQRTWQIGGATTLRGYDAAAQRGDTFWLVRGEVGLGMPFARLSVFGDAGWAGPRDQLEQSRPLQSAGVGVSLLDGLVRVDLARALDAPRGWKVHMQVGGF